jgi:putative methionine-R-sulfoxide reductase with GAF domain
MLRELNILMPPETSTTDGDQSLEDLRRELAEARRREAATAEILRVISRSPTDIERVLDGVIKNAARLCDPESVGIFRRDGDKLVLIAHDGELGQGRAGEFSLPLIRGTLSGRAVLEARTIQVADLQSEGREYPEGSEIARKHGHRTELSVPLLRDGVAVGSISLRRSRVQPFTEAQIALMETFAASGHRHREHAPLRGGAGEQARAAGVFGIPNCNQ